MPAIFSYVRPDRGFVMRMIMMVVLEEVLTINDFCFCTFRKLYFHGKKNLDKHISNQDFIIKPQGKKTSTVPRGLSIFSLQSTQWMGASLQARGEKGIFNSYSKIQNSKCCQLILRKLQIVRAFFNRKSYFACWLLQQFVGYAKSLFLCSTSLWRFFLTESSCVVILVGGGAVLLCNFSTLIISQRSL